MMFIAFLLRPWIVQLEEAGANPRVLADDLLVDGEGEDHEAIFKRAYDFTHVFLKDVGAKISPSKSWTYSSERTTRAKLRTHQWEHLQNNTIAVHNGARDLGCHLCTTAVLNSPTLTARINEAILTCNRIRRTAFPPHKKALMVRMVVLTKALYGIEAAPACGNTMAKLRHTIANTISTHTKFTAAPMVFTIASYGTDLDPEVEALTRRATMIRRMGAKHPEVKERIATITSLYQKQHHPGTLDQHGEIRSTMPAPPPGHADRKLWKHMQKPQGPVGLLMGSLHCIGAAIDEAGVIHQAGEPSIDVHTVPWQHLRPTICERGAIARNAFACRHRAQLIGSDEIDISLANRALDTRGTDEARWLRTVMQLDTWTDSRLASVSESNNGQCSYCGAENGDAVHLLWTCPHFHQQRCDGDPLIGHLQPAALPPALRLGLPTAMPADESELFWRPHDANHNEHLRAQGALFKGKLPPIARNPLHKRQAHHYDLNARQFMAALRHGESDFDIQLPTRCTELPPPDPNVYTDGSLKHPRFQEWSLGGFGIWWPNRNLDHQPLNDTEEKFAQSRCNGQGTGLCAAIITCTTT